MEKILFAFNIYISYHFDSLVYGFVPGIFLRVKLYNISVRPQRPDKIQDTRNALLPDFRQAILTIPLTESSLK